jgi:hypothetical protein
MALMVAFALVGLAGGAVLALVLLVVALRWRVEVVYIRVAWIPLAGLIAQALSIKWLAVRLGFALIVPPLLTCIVSLFLAVIGATLLASARQRGEHVPNLLLATLVAAMPGVLGILYIVWSVVGSVLRSRSI